MSLLRWLGLAENSPAIRQEADAIRRISEALDRLPEPRARFIAAFAYLLGRVAYADREVRPEETRTMERLIVDRVGLPEAQSVLVVQIARAQNLMFGGTEDFLVARQFAEMATRDQKLALLDCLYAVSAADESVTVVEDNEVGRIANELKLEHADVVAARSRYRQFLSVLKRPQEPREN
jgi:uncharacterized tellurite resistance protein B-like protein